MGIVKELNIKNKTYYFFNDIVDIGSGSGIYIPSSTLTMPKIGSTEILKNFFGNSELGKIMW